MRPVVDWVLVAAVLALAAWAIYADIRDMRDADARAREQVGGGQGGE